jgi:hypothetical protein
MNIVMRRYVFILALCAVIFISCGSTPSSDSSAEWRSRRQIYMNFLREDGYSPSIDKDGDIMFKLEGLTWYILFDKNDPSFFTLALLNIWSIDSDSERREALNAISYANNKTKAAKMFTSGSRKQWVSIAVEMYLEKPDDLKILFKRLIGAINSAKNDFLSQM